MKKLATGFLLLVWGTGAVGQAPLVKQWDKRYGGTHEEELSSLQQTTDGGYILGGYTTSDIGGDKTQPRWGITFDFWIIKIDSLGIKQWDKRFGGTSADELKSLQQTKDGGYIIGGRSFSGISGDKTQPSWGTPDYWIVKIDSSGTKQWDKRFGGTIGDNLTSLQQTTDGGYILGGYSRSGIGGDKTQTTWGLDDYWVVKIDSTGTKQWDKNFGGTGADLLYSVQQTTDGGYILGGWSSSGVGGDKTEPTRGSADYWVIKLDSTGSKVWDKRFGGTGFDYFASLQQTKDGGYIIGGWTASNASGDKTQPAHGGEDYWILKLDSAGTKQWDKDFGGTGREEFYKISQTVDVGFLLSGDSYSQIGGDKTENNLGFEQVWIVKTDSLGNKQWDKTAFTTGHDEIGLAIQAGDGCYLFAGMTPADTGGYKTQGNRDTTNSTHDFWIIKFCDTTQTQHCNLAAPNISSSQTTFCATDSTQICAPFGFTNYQWNNGATTSCITTSQAGNYYVTVTDNSGCTAVSNHLAINVYPLPPVSISVSGDTLTAYNAVTYQWYLNGGAINGATDNIYIATQGGSYSVAVTDSNGCAAVSSPVVFTGIENFTEGDVVSVYPNPNDFGFWILECGSNYLGGSLEIFDAKGRMVLSSKLKEQSSKIEFDGARGIYLLRINSAKGSVVRKLVRM